MEAAPSQAGASVGSGSMSPFSPRRGGERALPRPVHPDTGVSPAPEPPAPSAPSRPHRRGGPCGHAPHQNQHRDLRLLGFSIPGLMVRPLGRDTEGTTAGAGRLGTRICGFRADVQVSEGAGGAQHRSVRVVRERGRYDFRRQIMFGARSGAKGA